MEYVSWKFYVKYNKGYMRKVYMIKVVAAILEKEDKILIAKKREGKPLAGLWEFPGGKIEEGETPEESLIRELMEEMNIKVRVNEYVGESIYD